MRGPPVRAVPTATLRHLAGGLRDCSIGCRFQILAAIRQVLTSHAILEPLTPKTTTEHTCGRGD